MLRITIVFALSACSFNRGERSSNDAAIDSPVATDGGVAARSQREIVSGAGRAKAGTITIDVEVGHGIAVRKSTAGGKTIEGAPVVKP
jgi:hypothetical protein